MRRSNRNGNGSGHGLVFWYGAPLKVLLRESTLRRGVLLRRGKPMYKHLAASTVLVVALLIASTALAAPGAERFMFFGGFGAAAHCDGSGIIPSPQTQPAPNFGFAIIQAAPNGRVQATVAIRDIPGSYYTVRLIQGAADCHTVDKAGLTNSSGAMTINVSEAAVSSTAFVAVDQYATFGGVPFEVNSSYVTETYRH
jgi:hypothetical protein